MVGSQGGEFIFELAPKVVPDQEVSVDDLKQTIAKLKQENQSLKLQLAKMSVQANTVEQKSTLITGISYTQRKSKADIIHRKALALYKNKQYKKALIELELALNYLPNSANVVNDYGFILFRDGQYQKAQSWLEKTIELDARRTSVSYTHLTLPTIYSV